MSFLNYIFTKNFIILLLISVILYGMKNNTNINTIIENQNNQLLYNNLNHCMVDLSSFSEKGFKSCEPSKIVSDNILFAKYINDLADALTYMLNGRGIAICSAKNTALLIQIERCKIN
jgi:hypothetical protein